MCADFCGEFGQRCALQYPAVFQCVLIGFIPDNVVVGRRTDINECAAIHQLAVEDHPRRYARVFELFRVKQHRFFPEDIAAGILGDAPLGGVTLAVVIDDDFVRLADTGCVQADLDLVTPLGYRHDNAPRHAARLGHGRAHFQRHADAVAGVGGRAVEGPAFVAGAIEKGLAHFDVVFVAATTDDDSAAREVPYRRTLMRGGDAYDCAVIVNDQRLRGGLVVHGDVACGDTGDQAGVKGLARFFFFLLRAAGTPGVAHLEHFAGVGAADARVLGFVRAGEIFKRRPQTHKRLELRVQALHKRLVVRRVLGPGIRQCIGEFRLRAFQQLRQVFAAEHGLGVLLDRLVIAVGGRAVKAATTHARVGGVCGLGLLFKNDGGRALLVRRNGRARARAAEADDDDVGVVFQYF